MTPNPEIAALCNRRALAARAVYRERMATSVASSGAAAKAFKDALVAFADEPSPHNAGRYLAASDLFTALTGEVGTSAAPAAADQQPHAEPRVDEGLVTARGR
jgi:hypothetical protein